MVDRQTASYFKCQSVSQPARTLSAPHQWSSSQRSEAQLWIRHLDRKEAELYSTSLLTSSTVTHSCARLNNQPTSQTASQPAFHSFMHSLTHSVTSVLPTEYVPLVPTPSSAKTNEQCVIHAQIQRECSTQAYELRKNKIKVQCLRIVCCFSALQ